MSDEGHLAAGSAPERVLVTGADGFVGRWLIPALRERLPERARVFGSSRQPTASPVPGSEPVGLDVTDRDQVIEIVRSLRPTCVVHLAAIANVAEARRDARKTFAVNLGGTLNLAEAVREEAPTARFVFVGTSEAYGATFKVQGAPLREDAPLNPTSTYGASKAAADLLIGQMAQDGLDAVRFRPFNHTGPGQTEHYVVSAFAAQVARVEAGAQAPVLRVGNLDAYRDFLDVRDIVDAYVRAVLLPSGAIPPGTVLNVASGTPRRIGEALDVLLRLSSVPIAVEPDPERMRPHDTPFAAGDPARARELLGWAPRIAFPDMVEAVLDEWRRVVGLSSSEGGARSGGSRP